MKEKIREILVQVYNKALVDSFPAGGHGRAITIDEALESILALLPRWVPVGERLPEEDARVITYQPCGFDSFEIDIMENYESVTQPCSRCGEVRRQTCFERVGVTHWQPIPAAPQEEE